MILVSKSKIVGTTCLLDFYSKHFENDVKKKKASHSYLLLRPIEI